MDPDPKTRLWTVGFNLYGGTFNSEPVARDIAEQVQDSIEDELMTVAWLNDAGPLKP